MAILSVNAGSSSLKFSVYPTAQGQVQAQVLKGNIQGLEPGGNPVLDWSFGGTTQSQTIQPSDEPFVQALHVLGEVLQAQKDLPTIQAVAHRVVHGGSQFAGSVEVTEPILQALAELNSLAPLHQPNNLLGIRAFKKAFPTLPQIACFDTAFHATINPLNHSFALPKALAQQGVRRYGFHGLSYQYIMGKLLEQSPRAQGRVLMAHLGNGASVCGALEGKSVATSMGFSALDGLMMGTRSGNLDPGVMLYLLEQGWDHQRLQDLLYRQSGLLGVSGISADMRRLRQDGSPAAQFAIDLFTHRVVQQSGAMIASLEGLDVLAFSGGIGEHDAVLRAQLCKRLAWLGVSIDDAANSAADGNAIATVHAPDSRVEVWVVPTDEGLVSAREAQIILATRSSISTPKKNNPA